MSLRCPEPVEGSKGRRAGGERDGRGDLGVHFDKLNVLGGKQGRSLSMRCPELVEGSKGRGMGESVTAGMISGYISTGSMYLGEARQDLELAVP